MTKQEELMLAESKAWKLYGEATAARQKAEEIEDACSVAWRDAHFEYKKETDND
tara:strand:+ start:344 stop:505 length:162 start_codon:yes stop_codon:yes gene_type:complete